MNQQIELKLGNKSWALTYENLAIIVLSILYLVGIVGISIPIHPDFALLTPLNLLFSLATVLYFHPNWNRDSLLFLILCFGIGYGAEVFGVHTGLLFGSYEYGPVLGPKILETPLMIGVNWILLAYSSGMLINQLLPKQNKVIKAASAALVMVGLDIFIEPVAIKYDFWQWEGRTTPPLQNFFGWWLVAFIVLLFFTFLLKKQKNKVAIALLALQFIFFIALNLL
ncbi:MAG: hypothetical protein Sapg2KO_20530 [Saprospiraceae bacterium]